MKQNILNIEVKPIPTTEPTEYNGGVMFEHNATALQFHLDAAYLLPSYQFYLEFVTVHGVMRTDYLTPNAEGNLYFSIPQEVTQMLTALAILNIVENGENGCPKQLIKSHRVRLYFSNLENTEKQLNANYAFSVNQLLEAIANGTFRGEQGVQGEKGDNYTLLPTDKQAIADLINQEHFGLPLYTREGMQVEKNFSKMPTIASYRNIFLSPTSIEKPLHEIKLTIGKDFIAVMRKEEAFQSLYPYGIGYKYRFSIPTNTSYVLSKLNTDINTTKTFLNGGSTTIYLSDCTSPEESTLEAELHIGANGTIEIFGRDIGKSLEFYQSMFQNDWDGLTLTQKDKSFIIRTEFASPLYYLSEEYKDTFEVLSGKVQRNVHTLDITADMLPTVPTKTLQADETVLYGYEILLPADSPYKKNVPGVGSCNGMQIVKRYLSSNRILAIALGRGENVEGVCMNTPMQSIMIYSKKPMEDIKNQLKSVPLQVFYPIESYTEEISSPQTIPNTVEAQYMNLAPYYAKAEVTYTTDISEKTNDLESRIKALENRL